MRKACPSCCVTSSSGSAGTQPLLRINAPPQAGRGWRAACWKHQPALTSCFSSFISSPPSTSQHPCQKFFYICVSWRQSHSEMRESLGLAAASSLGRGDAEGWARSGELLCGTCSADISSAPLPSKGSNTARITRRIFLHFVSFFFFFLAHSTVYCLICSTGRLIEEILCFW